MGLEWSVWSNSSCKIDLAGTPDRFQALPRSINGLKYPKTTPKMVKKIRNFPKIFLIIWTELCEMMWITIVLHLTSSILDVWFSIGVLVCLGLL